MYVLLQIGLPVESKKILEPASNTSVGCRCSVAGLSSNPKLQLRTHLDLRRHGTTDSHS
jgi:hypothetical protein